MRRRERLLTIINDIITNQLTTSGKKLRIVIGFALKLINDLPLNFVTKFNELHTNLLRTTYSPLTNYGIIVLCNTQY